MQSITGCMIFMNTALIHWFSKQHPPVVTFVFVHELISSYLGAAWNYVQVEDFGV